MTIQIKGEWSKMANFAAKNQKPENKKFKSELCLTLIYYQLNKYAIKLIKFPQVSQVYSIRKKGLKKESNGEPTMFF